MKPGGASCRICRSGCRTSLFSVCLFDLCRGETVGVGLEEMTVEIEASAHVEKNDQEEEEDSVRRD